MKTPYLFILVIVTISAGASPAWSQWLNGPGGSIHNSNTGSVRVGAVDEAGGHKFFVAGSVGIAPNTTDTSRQLILGYNSSSHYGYMYTQDLYGSYKNLVLSPSGGNVGIRTSTPTHPLTVGGQIKSTAGGFVLPDGTILDSADDIGSGIWYDGMTYTYAPTAYSVGIGTTGPSAKLDVVGTVEVNGDIDLVRGDTGAIHSVGSISFDWTAGSYDNAAYHGLRSYDESAGRGDDLSINSYDHIINRIDSNNNNSTSYFKVEHHTYLNGEDLFWVRSADGNGYFKGNLGIGTTSPGTKLHVNGSVRGNRSGALRVDSGNGYIDIGAKNTSWAHFYTDRPMYYFNKEIRVNTGHIGSYNENLSLRTGGATRLTIQKSNGYVGIGTTAPTHRLTVGGPVKSISGGFILPDGTILDSADDVDQWTVSGANIYRNSGYVGIGTMSPQSLLAVNGTITAQEVKVTQIGWPDYVFADDYALMPLAELEWRVKQKRHLPGIPSAAEIKTDGLNIGEMQVKLLQKIEELTLYMIEVNKENDMLKAQMAVLEQTIR